MLKVKETPLVLQDVTASCAMYSYGVGRCSLVAIAIRYGLDGPWIESRWGGRNFPDLPTQPSIQWILALFLDAKVVGAWR